MSWGRPCSQSNSDIAARRAASQMADADVVFPALGGVHAALLPLVEALLRVTAGFVLVLGLWSWIPELRSVPE
jgi:hypothetical protein